MSLATKLVLDAVIWDIVAGFGYYGGWQEEVCEVEFCHDAWILSRYKNQRWATLQVSVYTYLHVTNRWPQFRSLSAHSFM
jgi:hypothetical protein